MIDRRLPAGQFAVVIIAAVVAQASMASERTGLETALAHHSDQVSEWRTTHISTTRAAWHATGLNLQTGQELTFFTRSGPTAAGALPPEPRHGVFFRIGERGAPRNLAANFESITAAASGELFLTVRPTGFYWTDEHGSYPDAVSASAGEPLNLRIISVAWRHSAADGLSELHADPDASSAATLAIADLVEERSLPSGFDYLQILGRSNVWAAWQDDLRRGIHGQTTDDVGIVRLPLDIPLNNDTHLAFDWRYLALPALGPEDEVQFHDYVSIAIEFDNGQDITWFWSTALTPETSFTCPLPWWDERETHIVVQSGRDGLGEWFQHRRPIRADYLQAVGGTPPARITGVWFIVNSLFGRQPAEAYFANVVIEDDSKTTEIFQR